MNLAAPGDAGTVSGSQFGALSRLPGARRPVSACLAGDCRSARARICGQRLGVGGYQIKSPAFYGGANDSFFIKEVTVCSVTKYRLYCCYWIWIFLFLLLFFFWRLNPVCISRGFRVQLHFAWARYQKQELCHTQVKSIISVIYADSWYGRFKNAARTVKKTDEIRSWHVKGRGTSDFK